MNIIDHISVGVPSIAEATKFYDAVLATIDLPKLAETNAFAAYGKDTPQFLVMLPENGEQANAGNGVHICFIAPTLDSVNIFHAAALRAGGECVGQPGPRRGYPKADVHTCFVRDPFGNKLEAIHNGFAA